MVKRAVVLGARGQVGALLTETFASNGLAVIQVDLARPKSAEPGTLFLEADALSPTPALWSELAAADCVAVCLPERVALLAAERVSGAMAEGALWLDTLSVKAGIAAALGPCGARLEIASINPMFAPALGWAGNPVAFVPLSAEGPKMAWLEGLLTSAGSSVEKLTPERHDRLTAAIQTATHAAVLTFGAALLASGYDLEAALPVATPPHRVLLALLHRISSGNPEVYWDIQAYHPNGGEMRGLLGAALNGVQEAVGRDDGAAFAAMFHSLRAMLAAHKSELEEWGRRIISDVRRPVEEN